MRSLAPLWTDPTLRMLCFAVILFGCFPATVAPFQSLIAIEHFGIPDGDYALLLVVALMVNVAASVGIGILTDQRPSRRRMALMAGGAIVLAGVIVTATQSLVAFVVASVLFLPLAGTFLGQVFAVARLAMAHRPREEAMGLSAAIRALFGVPFVMVLPLWGQAFDVGLPLLAIYPALCLFGAALLALILTQWPKDRYAPWTEVKSGLGFRASMSELMRGPVLLRVMLIGGIHSGTTVANTVLALVFDAASGRGPGDVALFFGLFVLIEIGVTLSIGRMVRFARPLHIIAAGTFTYATFLVLLPVLAPSPLVWLLIVPAGAGGAMIYALAIGYLQDLLGSRAGAGASLLALQRVAADGLAALIFAVGAALSGYGLVAALGAAGMALSMVAVLWLDRRADP
jgi:hypothetical protein